MGTCIFCELSGDSLLCENDLAKAFYDNFPVNEGHTLVVPKRHVATLFEAGAEELAAINDLIFQVRELLEEKYRPDGYNVGVNVGEAGGQSVFHLHYHVIPRYIGDVENPRGGVRKIKKSIVPYPLEELRDERVLNKLVRDGVPELIRRAGKIPVCRIASGEEYGKLLQEKLYEEVREYSASGEVEELADILEVVAGLAERKGLGLEELLALAAAKRRQKGGFAGRTVLEKVIEKNTAAGGKNEILP